MASSSSTSSRSSSSFSRSSSQVTISSSSNAASIGFSRSSSDAGDNSIYPMTAWPVERYESYYDLSASVDGRYLYLLKEHDKKGSSKWIFELIDLYSDTLHPIEYAIDSFLGTREIPTFLFSTDKKKVSVVMESIPYCMSYGHAYGVFNTSINHVEKRIPPERTLVGQVIFADVQSYVGCQWGSDVFLILPWENDYGVQKAIVGRFNTTKNCMHAETLEDLPCNPTDAVAYDGKLWILGACNEWRSWFNPEHMLVINFEDGYKWEYKNTYFDPEHGWPSRSAFSLDIFHNKMWVYVAPNFWTLDLNSLKWEKKAFSTHKDYFAHDSLLHCHPSGKFILITSKRNMWRSFPAQNLFVFWATVPKLSTLAQLSLDRLK